MKKEDHHNGKSKLENRINLYKGTKKQKGNELAFKLAKGANRNNDIC